MGGFGVAKYSSSSPCLRTRAVPTCVERSAPHWWTVLGDTMHKTRSAAEYRSAAIHLWVLAAATTRVASHHAFADLAIIYETLADQGDATEKAAVVAPEEDRAARAASRLPRRSAAALPSLR
jgi:hypothetical protein